MEEVQTTSQPHLENNISEENKLKVWKTLRSICPLLFPLSQRNLFIPGSQLWQEKLKTLYFQKLAAHKTEEEAKAEIAQFISTHINLKNSSTAQSTDQTKTDHLFTITIKIGENKIGDIFLSLSNTEEEPFKQGNDLPLFSNSIIAFLVANQASKFNNSIIKPFLNAIPIKPEPVSKLDDSILAEQNKFNPTPNDIAFAQAEEKLQLAIANTYTHYKVTLSQLQKAFLYQTIAAKQYCFWLWKDAYADEEYKAKLVEVLNVLTVLVNNPDDNHALKKMIELAHQVDRNSSHDARLAGKLMSVASLLLMIGIFTILATCPLGPIAAVILIAIFMAATIVGAAGIIVRDFNRPTELAKTLEKVKKTYKDKTPTSSFSFIFFDSPKPEKNTASIPPTENLISLINN